MDGGSSIDGSRGHLEIEDSHSGEGESEEDEDLLETLPYKLELLLDEVLSQIGVQRKEPELVFTLDEGNDDSSEDEESGESSEESVDER
jgi:hypothetical protein